MEKKLNKNESKIFRKEENSTELRLNRREEFFEECHFDENEISSSKTTFLAHRK